MKIYETLESGIKIVEYEPSLAPSIAEMWNMSRDDWGGGSEIMTASQVIAKHETASNFNVYIAMDGDTAVGYCSFARYYADANTLYIPLLGVRTDYKSKKIGKALVLRCVQRTIELGYPRLDLYTWSGNTAAVPLYKKCGFLWEDRPDYTHLVNFIPSILTTSLFADFFKKTDWYADSTRALEIAPDGVKADGFETFGYTWEKDGDKLAIDYERSGRQIRSVETSDYKIELFAQDHELAFGLDYNCRFVVENKTGKPLNIKINGKEDKNIRFDYTLDTQVEGVREFNATFHVGETNEIQDLWKVHPCLLAEVEINGHAITMGMGIETKFPLFIEVYRETVVNHIGAEAKTHFAIHSGLLEDAKVTLSLPQSKLIAAQETSFTTDLSAKGKATVSTMSTTTGIGFEILEIACTAELKNSKSNFTVKAEVTTQDLTHAFAAETFHHYQIFNGPWMLQLEKDGNEAGIKHLTNQGFAHGGFEPPKFGKPYDDEFNLHKPRVTMCQQGTTMVMEAEFVSEKFPGMVVTQVYTLAASGIITRFNKIENRAAAPQKVTLRDCYDFALWYDTVFSYNRQITQNHETSNADGIVYGLSNISPDGFDENWVFDASLTNPKGYCWATEYKPYIQWGSNVAFEIDPGELTPGQIFETKPVVYVFGMFANFADFRNFARQTFDLTLIVPTRAVDIKLNGYNPFITGETTTLEILNNRDEARAGEIIVSCSGNTESQTNPDEEQVECNAFDVFVKGDIGLVDIKFSMVNYEKTAQKVVFSQTGAVAQQKEGTVYSVSNGAVTFKADPKYGHVCYSLTDVKGQEWLLNQYPDHKEFAWWNPFLGGLRVIPYHMNNIAVLKETITADFTEQQDCFGNLWKGICTTLAITEDDKFKGMTIKSYFLTLPGLPVVCFFYKLENGTGEYKRDVIEMDFFLGQICNMQDIFIEAMDKNQRNYRTRLGDETGDIYFENVATIKSTREEALYFFHGNKNNSKSNYYGGDSKFPMYIGSNIESPVADKQTFTSAPAFFIITDKELPSGALDDLERISFSEIS